MRVRALAPVVALLVGLHAAVAVAQTEPPKVKVTTKPAPSRNPVPTGPNDKGNNHDCPPTFRFPGLPGDRESDTDSDKGDKDVDMDGDLDWFMGEWKFVLGDDDVIVRVWCINADLDVFSYEILDSKKGEEIPTPVTPGTYPT